MNTHCKSVNQINLMLNSVFRSDFVGTCNNKIAKSDMKIKKKKKYVKQR